MLPFTGASICMNSAQLKKNLHRTGRCPGTGLRRNVGFGAMQDTQRNLAGGGELSGQYRSRREFGVY
jgi:hypothetical protein